MASAPFAREDAAMRKTLPSILFLLALATAPRTQDEPLSVEQVTTSAHEFAQQLGNLRDIAEPTAEQKAELTKGLQELDEFVATIAKTEGLTARHYIEASSPLIAAFPAQARKIAEHGVKHFPESRPLWDHVGLALRRLTDGAAPSQQRVASLQAAEQALRTALTLTPDTFHTHLGLYQVLEELDQCDEALQQLDLGLASDEGKAAVQGAWLARGRLLLRLGRAKEAVAALTGADVPAEAVGDVQILTLRAYAIAGDAAAAQKAIEAMRAADPGPRFLVEAADALAYLGKKPEALKLLAQRPKRAAFKSEQERIAQQLSSTAEAMEVFWKATDFTAKGPLRAGLTKALDHHILLMDPTAKAGAKETDLSTSPVLIANMLANMPKFPIEDWGNRVLQVLSVRAAPDHKPSPLEQKFGPVIVRGRSPTVVDEPAVLLAMRNEVGNPEACGVLTGVRAAEKLAAPAAAKKPAPAKK